MPAAAPAKHAEVNLVFVIDEFPITFGVKMSCDALSSVGVAINRQNLDSSLWVVVVVVCGNALAEQTFF
jgi:hypothetical protein